MISFNSIHVNKQFVILVQLFLFGCNNLPVENLSYFNNKQKYNFDYSYIRSVQNPSFVLPIYKYLIQNQEQIPAYAQTINYQIINSKDKLHELIHYSFMLLNANAGGFGPPIINIPETDSVKTEKELENQLNNSNITFEIKNHREWNKLPFKLRKTVTEFIILLQKMKRTNDQFFIPIRKFCDEKKIKSRKELLKELMIPWNKKEMNDFSSVDLIADADLRKLSFLSRKIFEKINEFKNLKKDFPKNFSNCRINTDFGKVLINGTKKDYVKGDYMLIIDLGGDDEYFGNTASPFSSQNSLSIIIDYGGNDIYTAKNDFLVSAVCGIAALIDLGGDDRYETKSPGIAFSLYGTSVLYDSEGNDTYISTTKYGQSSAVIGSSIFADLVGDDEYTCRSFSQGFAGTLGSAIFLDYNGNDTYNTDLLKHAKTNNKIDFVQGAALGRWAEATDGHSLAGGIGIFIENEGNDSLYASSFSQGASYYFGIGLCFENKGHDKLNAISHSQGYAAHYAISGLFEKAGNDIYNNDIDSTKVTQVLGGGRDISVGWFIDHKGNDSYNAGNRSAGIGDMYGIGIFLDLRGTDKYNHIKNKINQNSPSFGNSVGRKLNSSKIFIPNDLPSLGIFIDTDLFQK